MAEANALLILILVIIVVFFPNIWAKIVSGIVLLIQLFVIITVQNAVIDAGIDTSVQVLEQYDIIEIPTSFCPASFNRTDYCVEFGLEDAELNGQVFLTGNINEFIDVRFETKEKTFSCPLQTGKACNFAQIKNAEDLKVSLTDKRGTVVLTSEDIAKDVKRYSEATRFAKFGKVLNKIIP